MIDKYDDIDRLIKNGKSEEAESLLFNELDSLTDKAGADCDIGDYRSAVEKYRLIINLMQQYYGDSVDLDKIEENIAEIQRLI